MIRLTDSNAPIERTLQCALEEFRGKHGPAALVFAHVHALDGQIHWYLSLNEKAEPYDDLVGKRIDDTTDLEDWEKQSGYRSPTEEELTVQLVNHDVVTPVDFDDFQTIAGRHANEVIQAFMARLPLQQRPKRVLVWTEYGEFSDEWTP